VSGRLLPDHVPPVATSVVAGRVLESVPNGGRMFPLPRNSVALLGVVADDEVSVSLVDGSVEPVGRCVDTVVCAAGDVVVVLRVFGELVVIGRVS
jgi:hypothetical protein